jgi:hypothetical protein
LDLSKKYVFPELMELLRDEEAIVRISAYDCFVSLLDFYDVDTRRTLIAPYAKALHRDPKENVMMIAKHFGQVIHKLASKL